MREANCSEAVCLTHRTHHAVVSAHADTKQMESEPLRAASNGFSETTPLWRCVPKR